jgi:transcriptional regulator with XRE-family HTH domain
MGKQTRIETYFRNRLKNERERRGWSQTDMANRLSDKGIHVHMTTIAKIEAGQRAVRIDEATAIADLFEMSLDALLGRGAGLEDDLAYSLRTLREVARRARGRIPSMAAEIADARHELGNYEFRRRGQIDHIAEVATYQLTQASISLMLLEQFTEPTAAVPEGTTVEPAEIEPGSRMTGDDAFSLMAKFEELAASTEGADRAQMLSTLSKLMVAGRPRPVEESEGENQNDPLSARWR